MKDENAKGTRKAVATKPSTALPATSSPDVLDAQQSPSSRDSSTAARGADQKPDSSRENAPSDVVASKATIHGNSDSIGRRNTHGPETKARPLSPPPPPPPLPTSSLRPLVSHSRAGSKNGTKTAAISSEEQRVIKIKAATTADQPAPASGGSRALTPGIGIRKTPAKVTTTTGDATMHSAVVTAEGANRSGGPSRKMGAAAAPADKSRFGLRAPRTSTTAVAATGRKTAAPAEAAVNGGAVKGKPVTKFGSVAKTSAADTAAGVRRDHQTFPSVNPSTSSPEKCEFVVVVTPEDDSTSETLVRTTVGIPSAGTNCFGEKSKPVAPTAATQETRTKISRTTARPTERRKTDVAGAKKASVAARSSKSRTPSPSGYYSHRPWAVRASDRNSQCISAVFEANKPFGKDACWGERVHNRKKAVPLMGNLNRSTNISPRAVVSPYSSSCASIRDKYSVEGNVNPLATKTPQISSTSVRIRDKVAARDERAKPRGSSRVPQIISPSSVSPLILDKSSREETVHPLTVKTPRIASSPRIVKSKEERTEACNSSRALNTPRGPSSKHSRLNPASRTTPTLTASAKKDSPSFSSKTNPKATAATPSSAATKRPRGIVVFMPAVHSHTNKSEMGVVCSHQAVERTRSLSRLDDFSQSTGKAGVGRAAAVAQTKQTPVRLNLSLHLPPYSPAGEAVSTSGRVEEEEEDGTDGRGLLRGAEEAHRMSAESGGVGVSSAAPEETSESSSSAEPLRLLLGLADSGLAHSQSRERKADTHNSITASVTTSTSSARNTSTDNELSAQQRRVDTVRGGNELRPDRISDTRSTAAVESNSGSISAAAATISATASSTDTNGLKERRSRNSDSGFSELVSHEKLHAAQTDDGSTRVSLASTAAPISSDSTGDNELGSVPSPREYSSRVNSTIITSDVNGSAAALTEDFEPPSHKTAHASEAAIISTTTKKKTACVGGGVCGGDDDGEGFCGDGGVGTEGEGDEVAATKTVRCGAGGRGSGSKAERKLNERATAAAATVVAPGISLAVPVSGYYRRRPPDSGASSATPPPPPPATPSERTGDGREHEITITTTADHDSSSSSSPSSSGRRRKLEGLPSRDRNNGDVTVALSSSRSGKDQTDSSTITTTTTTTTERHGPKQQPLLAAETQKVELRINEETAPQYSNDTSAATSAVSSASSLSDPLAYRQLLQALESTLKLGGPQQLQQEQEEEEQQQRVSSSFVTSPSERETTGSRSNLNYANSLSSSACSPSPLLSPAQEGDFRSDSVRQLTEFWTPLASRRNSVVVLAESDGMGCCGRDGVGEPAMTEERGRRPEAEVGTGSHEDDGQEDDEEEEEAVPPVFFRDRRPSAVYFTPEKNEGFPWLTWASSVHPDQQELRPSPHDKLEAVSDPNYILDLILDVGDILGQGQYGTVYEVRLRSPRSSSSLGGRGGTQKPGGGAGKGRGGREQKGEVVMALKKLLKISQETTVHALAEQRALLIGRECPFVVTMFSCFQTKLAYYILLELAEGGSLTDVLKDAGRLPEQNLRFFAAQLMAALSFLHDRDILHRDLKVDNVLMDAAGYVRLCDFGLSMDEFRDDDQVCSPCGTLFYVAPEVLRGEPYSKAADWWSYGVLIYQLATGTLPFEGLNIQALYVGVTRKEPVYPSFLSVAAVSFIKKMLTKNHAKRPGNTAQQRQSLQDDPFFSTIDWTALFERSLVPPALPEHRLWPSNHSNSLSADTDVVLSASMDVLYMTSAERDQQAARQTRSRSLDPSGLFAPLSLGDGDT